MLHNITTRRDVVKFALSGAGSAFILPCFGLLPDHARKARFWETLSGTTVRCRLCPRSCVLKNGATGSCRTRRNDNGTLVTIGYGNPCAAHVDPIEKKPLYHVLPGARAYSIAVAGCNLHCQNCQNHTISQASPLETPNFDLSPQTVVEEARNKGCTTIAYTYSEPIVWYEYMYDTAKLAHRAGLKNLLVTCGYINPQPLKDLAPYIDAANIDLKSFSDDIYKKLNAGHLQPVLDTITLSRKLGIWVELTNLVVPEWTDDSAMVKAMVLWITEAVGKDVPLHFSRFSPLYKLAHLYPTPVKTLLAARDIAKDAGLHYVYVGNVAETDSNTYCPNCKKALVRRTGYLVMENKITNGKCVYCGHAIAGIWHA